MIRGITDGGVLQRGNDNKCDIIIYTDKPEKCYYKCNGSELFEIELIYLSNDKYRLKGMPVGGPYTLIIGKSEYKNIYVGDLWVLAGQSNMQGVG